jgi:hypothetical protein
MLENSGSKVGTPRMVRSFAETARRHFRLERAARKGRKEEEVVPATNPGERTGETWRPMIGYM